MPAAGAQRPVPPDGIRPGSLEAGDQLAGRLRVFQQALHRLATEQGRDALTGPLLPYALHFGMIRADEHPLSRFAHDWVRAFSALPGWHLPEPKALRPQRRPGPHGRIAHQLWILDPVVS
jgi:hypothetical protein